MLHHSRVTIHFTKSTLDLALDGMLQKAALWPMALWPMANGLMFSSNCTNTFHSCSTESICKLVQRLLITCKNYLSASCGTCSDQ